MFTPHGSPDSGANAPSLVSVLLIEENDENALRIGRQLESHVPNLLLIHTHGLREAREALEGCSPDLIMTRHPLPDGTCRELNAIANRDTGSVPVLAYVRDDAGDPFSVLEQCPNLLDCMIADSDGDFLRRTPTQFLRAIVRVKRKVQGTNGSRSEDVLRRVRHTISRVNHDLNNPLSIISGNAQLLAELANALDLDSDLLQPIQDIEEASTRVAGILRRLVDLRDQLPADEELSGDVRAELRSLQAHRQRNA